MAPLARSPSPHRVRVTPAFRPSSLAVPGRTPLAQSRPSELWLAIHLPSLLLDSLRDVALALPGRPPVAIVDLERNGKVVRACEEAAHAAGVREGMSINAALALVPGLHALARDARRERQLLEAVAQRGVRFTPRVSIEQPDGVLLEVRGSLRLFGGARQLCLRLQQELTAATGATVRFAITPTPLASLWFARTGLLGARPVFVRNRDELAARLALLPLDCTRWPARSIETLGTMGVRTVGDCLRLPRAGFARRFGHELLATLDRATGRVQEPRAAYAARERFAARRDLEPEIADTARLGLALAPLLEELCQFLRERGRGVQAIEVQLRHRDAPLTRARLRFVQPVGAQPRHMAELLSERLAPLVLPQPVRNVRLLSGPLIDLQADATELFAHDRRESGENLPQLVERLRARLGNGAVHALACVPEHRPEAAWRAVEPTATKPRARQQASSRSAAPNASSPAVPLPWRGERSAARPGEGRPLWLLDRPEPCDVDRLVLEEGPECIESGWWDGHDVARDYYIARNAQGARLWVFRKRRETTAGARWFLHGWFA
ncbi:MAG: DNA polymerase Y family protein [Proteobacteria bacterium]|nr:DNA polymerase Y family protein [Pseudomonadota bacterium]